MQITFVYFYMLLKILASIYMSTLVALHWIVVSAVLVCEDFRSIRVVSV